MVLDHAERASEIVAEAFFAAMSGRPGPVVIGLPEDVIRQRIIPALHPRIPVATGGMMTTDSEALASALAASSKPLFVTGGNDWTQDGAEQFTGGAPYEDKGTILECAPGRRLVMTHYSPLSRQEDKPENYHTLTWTLEGTTGTTQLTLSQDNNASPDEAQHAKGMWDALVASVKTIAERV
jgi:uncharacterized protein YndB with AHSA1/START domain